MNGMNGNYTNPLLLIMYVVHFILEEMQAKE